MRQHSAFVEFQARHGAILSMNAETLSLDKLKAIKTEKNDSCLLQAMQSIHILTNLDLLCNVFVHKYVKTTEIRKSLIPRPSSPILAHPRPSSPIFFAVFGPFLDHFLVVSLCFCSHY